MTNTEDAGNAVGPGSIPLPRLNPREIATLLLPGTTIQIMDATDAQFQRYLVTANELNIADDEMDAWSFDDRVRFINHMRKRGIDLFTLPNENNSGASTQSIQNNSEHELIGELFAPDEAALQAISSVSDADLLVSIENVCDSVLTRLKKSSEAE